MMMATASPVTRLRQANPDIAGTDRDPIKIHRREIEQLLQEAGMEPGKEKIKGFVQGVLLIVKKNKES
jgi:hypothetical protein